MHPRTDAVVITAVLDETGNRILLGRNVGTYDICAMGYLTHMLPLFVEKVPIG